MVGQPGMNCSSILDNFRKKALGAYWLLLEPAPTSALLPNSESVAVSSEKYRFFAPNFPSTFQDCEWLRSGGQSQTKSRAKK